MIWITPIVFGVVGGIEALIAGSVVGGVYVEKPFFNSFRVSRANPIVAV